MRPLIGLGLVLVLRATTPAMAQPAAPAVELPASTDAKAESHRLYDAATADYTIGRFDQALAGYEAA